jgi:hypothetical protein
VIGHILIGPFILVALIAAVMLTAKAINRHIRRTLLAMDVQRQSEGKAPGLIAALIDTLYPEMKDRA